MTNGRLGGMIGPMVEAAPTIAAVNRGWPAFSMTGSNTPPVPAASATPSRTSRP
jgi:hypothetical protein